jgi:polyphosphate kinase
MTTLARCAAFPLLLLCSLSLAVPARAQPTESVALERELFGLNLDRVEAKSIGYLIRAQTTAEALANAGDARSARLVRYVVLLRQLAQLQEKRVVHLVDGEGRRIGVDPQAEALRVRSTLAALREGRPIPKPKQSATVSPTNVRDLLNREVSFLEFNRRVLAQAADSKVPPLERLRFLTIASANLDEFFRVRVSGLQEEVRNARTSPRSDGFTPQESLRTVLADAQALVKEQYRLLNQEVLPELKRRGVELGSGKLSAGEKTFARTWVKEHVAGKLKVVPMGTGALPRVADLGLNVLVTYGNGKKAVVQLPASLPQAVQLPGEGGARFRLATDLVGEHMSELLGARVVRSDVFRVTRNADLWGRSGVATSYGEAVRVELQGSAPKATREFLARELNLTAKQVVGVEGPVDLSRLADVIDVERDGLTYERPTPVRPAGLPEGANMFEAISRGDMLLHHPFESYDPVSELLEQAARDKSVTQIRQTLYRTGGAEKSITKALVAAAQAGKDVTVLVETRARFDELNNSEVTRSLRQAGVKVIFGPPGLKTHAKALTITRMEGGKAVRYSHLGTGNYNPGTAKIYTDYSFFTRDAAIATDLERVFRQLEASGGKVGPVQLTKLLQAPFTLQSSLLERIAAETAAARAGKPARITAKMNSLNDPKLIRALYAASQAGVQVDLLVRGVTTLRPGVPGLSENIRVRSLVGRFLEHTRVFQFHAGGKNATYLASADWMVRNTERRVELAFPIEDPRLKAEISATLETYLQDNTKAWELKRDGSYARVEPKAGAPLRNAQEELLARGGKPRTDRLRAFRRSDGTLDWKRLRKGGVREGVGLAHFGLALFLKELAVVARTGDRDRIEEFFEGLLTTDFYKHYGLFVAGARLSEVAYTRYLERYIRPGFVNGVLKTNLVLAAGLALPMIVEGQFSGKVFAISLTSLGLSSAAVKAGVASIRWVVDLKRVRSAGTMAALGKLTRLRKVGGWVYTAAELAVVLYVAEEVEKRINAHLDLRAARQGLGNAQRAFLAAANDKNATPASLAAAAADHHAAWGEYRNFLYRDLDLAEARFAERLKKIARRAKQLADEREAATKRIGDNPNLRKALLRAIATREEREKREVGERLQRAFDGYERKRAELLDTVYGGRKRASGFLDGLPDTGWLLSGAPAETADDPYAKGRVPLFSDLGRTLARAKLDRALDGASQNRLQTYEDEAALLKALDQRLRATGRAPLADALTSSRQRVARTQELDRRLWRGKGVLDLGVREGAAGKLPGNKEHARD